MRRTKTIRIAVFTIFSIAIATFATPPAQAKLGMALGYKYVSVPSIEYDVHVPQINFMWTIKGGGSGYREGGKRPKQAFGFALAIGGNRQDVPGDTISSVYFALPLVYEYVFANGLGISGGVTMPLIFQNRASDEDTFGIVRAILVLSTVGLSELIIAVDGVGVGVSDLGVNYHFNNGLTLYANTNLGYAIASDPGVMWGVGVGIGKWF